jgi:threonyl-tRNA synthetase
VSEKYNDYAYSVVKALKKLDIRAEVDDRNEKMGRKIRDNELKRTPYLLIVGEKEAENEEVSVRKQGGEDKGSVKLSTFASEISSEVEKMMDPTEILNEISNKKI